MHIMNKYGSTAGRKQGTKVWSTDVAVPLSRLAEIISKNIHAMLHMYSSIADLIAALSKHDCSKLGLSASTLYDEAFVRLFQTPRDQATFVERTLIADDEHLEATDELR